MVVSADVLPSAIKATETLAEVRVTFSRDAGSKRSLSFRLPCGKRNRFMDIADHRLAGRLAIDADMMDEIRAVHAAAKPAETLFVVDAADRSGCGPDRRRSMRRCR
jgi:signal recognition particle subunit SRP54